MKWLRLTHINFRVARLEPALDFYGRVLGLEEIARGEKEGRGAWFRVGEGEIHLTEDPAPQPLSKRHVALEVDDLEGARRAVLGGGGTIEKEEPGVRFWTRDPSGNRIEIARAPR